MTDERAVIAAQIDDLQAEGDDLYQLLAGLDATAFARPTGFKGWTFDDVIGHLHFSDHMGLTSLSGADAFRALMRDVRDARLPLTAYTRRWTGDLGGPALLQRWREGFNRMCREFAAADPATRLTWAGPDMGLRMFITARQMETWAHGQEVWDALGKVRVNTDRLRHIAAIGVRTFGWTFANRKLPAPGPAPHVVLHAPSGAVWTYNAPDPDNRIEGSAEAFCQVVTQVRNVADTPLQVCGPVAQAWMAIAQCFAGPPEEPPAPGTRGPAGPA